MLVDSAGGKSRLQKSQDLRFFQPNLSSLPYIWPFRLSLPPVEEAVNSIYWAHQLAVVDDPASHPLIKQTFAGAKRILAYRTTMKEPIAPEILHRMFNTVVTPSAKLPIIRTRICLLGYAGFFCFTELASLRECNIFFTTNRSKRLLNPARLTNSGTDPGYLLCILTQIYAQLQCFGVISKTNSQYPG